MPTQGAAGATVAEKRKSFEFRMSKKVAELTQVVHMLFVRNHEKEVELEALKRAYEEEITRVVEDAQHKLEEANNASAQRGNTVQQQVNAAVAKVEQEWSKKLEAAEHKVTQAEQRLTDEKKGSSELRECLHLIQNELDSAKTAFHNDKMHWEESDAQSHKTIAQLQARLTKAEKVAREAENRVAHLRSEVDARTLRMVEESQKQQADAENSERVRQDLETKTAELEQEIRNLRREFKRQTGSDTSRQVGIKKDRLESESLGEEMDQLKRELMRYKLELLNRDTTYNRIFKEQSSFLVDARAGLVATLANSIGSISAVNTSGDVTASNRNSNSRISGPVREKTFSYVSGQVYDTESSPQTTKFPQMHQSISSKLAAAARSANKLSKPKPPKNLLSLTN